MPDRYTPALRQAWLDGTSALSALVAAQTGLAALDSVAAVGDGFAKAALFSGLVVAYARAFEPVKEESSGRQKTFSIRGVDGFDRRIHEALLKLRDKYVAHAGHDVNDFTVMFVSVKAKFEFAPDNQGNRSPPAMLDMHIGSRGQASLPIGPTAADVPTLQAHLIALRTEASNRLLTALLAHHSTMARRIAETGSSVTTGDEPKIFHQFQGRIEPGKEVGILSGEDILASFPKQMPDFGMHHFSLHYQIAQSEGGEMKLSEERQFK